MAVDFKDVEDNSSHILSEKLKYIPTPPIPVSFRLLWLSPSIYSGACSARISRMDAVQHRQEEYTKEHWALHSKEDVGEDDRVEGDDIFFEKKIL